MKYIVKNCPNLSKSYYATGEVVINQCGLTDDDLCINCTYCLTKRVIEAVKTEERTPGELEAIKDHNKYLCQSARHNMSMMIQSMFEIQEVEE